MPSACTSKIGSVPSAESRRTPRASPRPAMIDWMAATERALPWPLAAGISARRHHSWCAMVASMGGFMNVLSMSSETWPSMAATSIGGGGMTLDTRWSSLAGRPMWKSASQRLGHLAGEPVRRCSRPVMRRTISPMR